MRRSLSVLVGLLAAIGVVAMPASVTVTQAASGHPPVIRLRQGTSTNGSGYAAFGAPGSFTSAAATWTQPAVTCTSQHTYSSYWVGLDGYNDKAVEQAGTEADW